MSNLQGEVSTYTNVNKFMCLFVKELILLGLDTLLLIVIFPRYNVRIRVRIGAQLPLIVERAVLPRPRLLQWSSLGEVYSDTWLR